MERKTHRFPASRGSPFPEFPRFVRHCSEAGSYEVIATIDDANYSGTATNTLLIAARPLVIENLKTYAPIPPDGMFAIQFESVPGSTFTVIASTNPALPLVEWSVLGAAREYYPGTFDFVDTGTSNYLRRFYRLRFP